MIESHRSQGTDPLIPPKKKKERAPASFAYKIAALSMVRRLLMLFQLNILFLVLVFTGLLVIAEQNMAEAYRDWQLTGMTKVGKCSIELERETSGVRIPDFISNRITEESMQGTRNLTLGSGADLNAKLAGLTYHAYIQQEDIFAHITYTIGAHGAAAKALPFILIIEMIIWLTGFFADLRSGQKLLQPLRDMTLSAQDLQKQAPVGEAFSYPQQNLNDLTGEINQIGAQLDAKLQVNDIELEGLAEAINAMLDRVHKSYLQQSEFVSDASHELRTPLAVIEGYANMLDRWGKHDEKTLQESVEAIKSESAHMKALVEQLLFLARGDNDTMALNWEILDIKDLTEEVYRGAQLVDQTHDWCFVADPSCLDVVVRGDEGLLKQTLRILTDNAIRYAPAGSNIMITIIPAPRRVRISVQDQGIGIASEDIPRVFDRFFRSESSRARSAGGTGLGLAIAKWIVEKHQGHIEVMSREGIGTRVTVELPRVELPRVEGQCH